MMALPEDARVRKTRVLPVDPSKIGSFVFQDPEKTFLGEWAIQLSESNQDAANLKEAALELQNSNIPVAFPTETVYGLGANAMRSSAVRGIYKAKQRPSDNPLIIHISSLPQLRKVFSMSQVADPIPEIYNPLISRFWPGPLTILIPVPDPSPLAPEVTNNLRTVAVRMPVSRLALALIHLAGFPLAAPSANASSKPSPTTADHVLFDLTGRIDIVLDGGACEVGLESTVVDGLSKPPVILRPGAISLDMIKECPGWEDVRPTDADGASPKTPRAPGMKYKHYSPSARVLIFHADISVTSIKMHLDGGKKVGMITTRMWSNGMTPQDCERNGIEDNTGESSRTPHQPANHGNLLEKLVQETQTSRSSGSIHHRELRIDEVHPQDTVDLWMIHLGPGVEDVAQGFFSALRELDQQGVDIILFQGLADDVMGPGAAIMNRLRKAAEAEIRM